MKTAVRQHQWIMHVLTPVEVLPGLEGEPVVVVDPDKRAAAEEGAVYGCMACSAPLSEAFGTQCPGSDDGQ